MLSASNSRIIFRNKCCYFSRSFQPKKIGFILYGYSFLTLLSINGVGLILFKGNIAEIAVKLSSKKIRYKFANYFLIFASLQIFHLWLFIFGHKSIPIFIFNHSYEIP